MDIFFPPNLFYVVVITTYLVSRVVAYDLLHLKTTNSVMILSFGTDRPG